MGQIPLATWLRGTAVLAALALVTMAQPALAIPITSVPAVIDTPGTYEVNQDLTYAAGSGIAIEIRASDVTVNFNGHRLVGPGADTTASAIVTGPPPDRSRSRVAIRGARISGFSGGILLFGDHHTIYGNTVTGCMTGIAAKGTSFTISGNTCNSNSLHGIQLAVVEASTLTGNIVNSNRFGIVLEVATGVAISRNQGYDNTENGIFLGVASGNILEGNVIGRSLLQDMYDAMPTCCGNLWRDNVFVTDNETGIAQGRLGGCIR